MKAVIARYGEIGIKSGYVRNRFELLLIENIRHFLKKNNCPFDKVIRERSRIVIEGGESEIILGLVKKVFGVVSCSVIEIIGYSMDEVKRLSLEIYKRDSPRAKKSFRMTVHRGDIDIGMSSVELASDVGAYIVQKTGAKVDLHNPEINVQIDIGKRTYLFTKSVNGPGGMPIGSQKKVVCFIKNTDDTLACAAMMRRGCRITVVDCGIGKKELGILQSLYSTQEELDIRDSFEEIDVPKVYGNKKINNIIKNGKSGLELFPLCFNDKEVLKSLRSKIIA